MKKVTLTKSVLPKSEIANLDPQGMKKFLMCTLMMRDLNLVQKCLYFSYYNDYPESALDEPNASARTTLVLFFLITLMSKIHEIWVFMKSSAVEASSTGFPGRLKEEWEKVKCFIGEKKVAGIFSFIRNKFGFHYERLEEIDEKIVRASRNLPQFEAWFSQDSANEIFVSSNEVILEVIHSEMKVRGFSVDTRQLMMEKLFRLALDGAKLFREFIVHYLNFQDAFPLTWEPQEPKEVEAAEITEVKMPLIVAFD